MNISDSKVMEELRDIKNLIEDIQNDIEDIKECDGAVTSRKILQGYDKDVRNTFLKEVKNAGAEGLDKNDIMKIFDVRETQAWKIQKELMKDYEWAEYKQRPGKTALTRHKKHAYADELAEGSIKTKEDILDKIKEDKSERTDIEILKEMKEKSK